MALPLTPRWSSEKEIQSRVNSIGHDLDMAGSRVRRLERRAELYLSEERTRGADAEWAAATQKRLALGEAKDAHRAYETAADNRVKALSSALKQPLVKDLQQALANDQATATADQTKFSEQLDKVWDRLGPRRRDALEQTNNVLRELDAEREAAGREYVKVFHAGGDLVTRDLVTNTEHLDAAIEHRHRVEEAATAAIEPFDEAITEQMDRLRGLAARGTSQDLERALKGVDIVMPPARREFEQSMRSAEALLATAKASLKELRASKKGPGLHNPRHLKPGKWKGSQLRVGHWRPTTRRQGRTSS